MGRLYAAFDVAQDDPTTGARRWKPDEIADRIMIAAIMGKPSAECALCGNRVQLEHARIEGGAWNQSDHYICSACRKYGTPIGRWSPREKQAPCCEECLANDNERAYFKVQEGPDAGHTLCEFCMYLVPGKPLITPVHAKADPKWYVVKPLAPDIECDICHEVGPSVPKYHWTAWLLRANLSHVCEDCNAAAKEMQSCKPSGI